MLRRLCVSSMTRQRHRTFTQGREHAATAQGDVMQQLMQELARQRWDDHRYYHHCRINQSLHLLSALCFVGAYILLFIDPALAAILAWCVSMTTRQAGHFFFEPRGYDHVNAATDAHKEAIKVGYNIRRKMVLMSVWAAMPLLLWLAPGLFGLIEPATTLRGYVHDVGIAWLALGVAGLLFRVLQLALTRDLRTALAWLLKILSDPFHDIRLYWRAPLALLRGERFDPMSDVHRRR
jgi:type IV secretory pathway VirB3-like protein